MVDYVGPTRLEVLFKSPQNCENIQTIIRKEVKVITNLLIDRQSDQELFIIMNHTFKYYALHQPHNLLNQINNLNKKVIELCVKSILLNLKDHQFYRQNLNKPRHVMDRPQQTSSKGTKSLNMF